MSLFCQKCGHRNASDAYFCSSCGAALEVHTSDRTVTWASLLHETPIGVFIDQMTKFDICADREIVDPPPPEGIRVQERRFTFELDVHGIDRPVQRRVDVRNRLCGFDFTHRLTTRDLLSDPRQLDENDLSKGILSKISDSRPGGDAIESDPFVVLREEQLPEFGHAVNLVRPCRVIW